MENTTQEYDKLKIQFQKLLDQYGFGGNTMTKEQLCDALSISPNTLKSMIKEGIAPAYFKTSKGKKASYKFYIIDVACYLCRTEST